MRLAPIATAALALFAGAAAPRTEATSALPASAAKSFPPVLGISYRAPHGALAWFDPLTLQVLRGRKAPLAGHTGSWAFSADRGLLAIASCAGDQEQLPGIRFVNARAMRVVGSLRLSRYRGCATGLTWLRRDRLLAVTSTSSGDDRQAVVVDPVARCVLRRTALPSWPSAVGRAREELVLLLGSSGVFAPARVAVVDAEGRARLGALERIVAGTVSEGEGEEHRARTIQPGLAVDPDGRRAFVVPASGPVAEVDLETLAVSYHELHRPSPLRRALRWLDPAAQAKAIEGPVREARWLGGGAIAVSGTDYSIVRKDGEELMAQAPAGLTLVDTGSWTARVLDREASGFAAASGLVIAQGGRWDSELDRGLGPGLRAFGLDGRERWRLHPGQYRWLDPAGPVGYVWLGEGRAEVVELATGSVLRRLARDEYRNPFPQLLAAQSASW